MASGIRQRIRLRTVGIDAAAVVIFCLIGRLSHDSGDAFAPLGILTTVWPFLGGLAAGYGLVAVTGRRPQSITAGAILWASTVVLGMLLRFVSGQGVQIAFVIVATVTLALLLIGWRAVASLVARWRQPAGSS